MDFRSIFGSLLPGFDLRLRLIGRIHPIKSRLDERVLTRDPRLALGEAPKLIPRGIEIARIQPALESLPQSRPFGIHDGKPRRVTGTSLDHDRLPKGALVLESES